MDIIVRTLVREGLPDHAARAVARDLITDLDLTPPWGPVSVCSKCWKWSTSAPGSVCERAHCDGLIVESTT